MLHIPGADGTVPVLLSLPTGYTGGPLPGVIAIHDILGLHQDITRISQRIADQGYIVATPDLYHGGKVRCITRVMREVMIGEGRSFDDLAATREALVARPECTGAVGVVGFCQGGRFALLVASRGYEAVAPFYSTPLPPRIEKHLQGSCPVVASFGRRDPFGTGSGAKLQRILDRADVENDIKTYPGAGHSFANELPAQPFLRLAGFAFHEEAATDSWERVFAFFGKHLRTGSPASP
ncbi:dienelactone hydrolase family protein [Mycobacteroides chelonae]|uniref:dienelactone hydrolase family protein n=1 Tax=Mycobacteroides chelonae TaxID=1774 RepID=UPI0009946006|nr:dienelactone hydrolase family protein [Mycobacteroides chelonae]